MKRKIDLRMYPFVKLVIPLGLGIVVGDTIWDIFPRVYWWILLCGSIFMTFVVSHWKYFQSFMMLLTIFFLGAMLTIEKEHAMLIKLPKGQVEYEAIIQTEPVVHGKIIQVDLLVLSAVSPQKISEFYIFQIINRITPNKEEKGYDLETSVFLFLSLFCNASKTTYLTLQR